MEKKFNPRGKERKRTNRKKWYKAVCSLAAAVVVCTVYTLMLPALTLDEESAGDAGVTISESSVPTSEAPAAESSKSDNGSESHNDTAADSSADSSHAAAAAPSDDRAPSTTKPTTEAEPNAPVTLPTEETNSGAITGSSESHDEVTSPDTDDQEKIKDEENNGSPAADKEEADNSGSSTDADAEEDDSEKSDDTADVEDAGYWETTIPDLSDCETWAEKLLAVAQSQIGYHESTLNFHVEDGEHKGYTRYGEWYGSPYGDWCAMFVSFCLNYAGIENNDSIIPYNANCQRWVEELAKIFEDPDTYIPEPGDIVFFNQEGNRDGAANHVGIVSDVKYGTKTVKRHIVAGTETAVEDSPIALLTYANSLISEETPVETLEATETEVTIAKSIEVIEGNSSDRVQTVTYDMTDSSILGFASMLKAEYINDGGNIDDFKNADQINQPATLENREMLAAQEISGPYTVEVGETISLTGKNSKINYWGNDYACTKNDEWKSDDEKIAKVEGKGNNAKVTGKAVGTVTITHTYCDKNDGHWYDHNKHGEEEITINVVEAPKPTSINITGENTVNLGDKIVLNAVFTPDGANAPVVWESSDSTIATIDNTGTVTGVKTGTVTITATSTDADGNPISANHEVTINRTSVSKAQFYYLKAPTYDPATNNTDAWNPDATKGPVGTVDVTGGVWTNNKNMLDGDIKLEDRIISWPSDFGTDNGNGTLTVTKTITKNGREVNNPHWTTIFNAYKSTLPDNIEEKDIEAIILHPYKISKDNATNPDYHVDCRVEIKCKVYVTATYHLWDADSDGYVWKAAKNYQANKGETTSYELAGGKIADIPETKKVGNTEYRFDGWYDNPERTGNKILFPYEMRDQNVNFYARYVKIDYNVNYAIANGCAGYGKINGDIVIVKEDLSGKTAADGCTAVPNDGYIFDGWYTDATCTVKVPDAWVVNGKIVPEQTDGSWKEISGKTFYAKFTTGVELPETGGPGTTLLYLLGAMLITAPLTITFIKRRRKENEEN